MKLFNKILLTAVASVLTLSTSSCLDEVYPENGNFTGEQIKDIDKAGLLAAIPAYMTDYSTDYFWDIGYSAFLLWREEMTANWPVNKRDYDYFYDYGILENIGYSGISYTFWFRYYYQIKKSNIVLAASNLDPESADAYAVGNALGYRAMCYLDMARMYEYMETGVPAMDQLAESRELKGKTVPIVDQFTTEEQSRHLPRAPFYELYRFILTDLDLAEKCLKNTRVANAKNEICLGVIYGLKARFWMELGTRFDLSPDDLATTVQNESNSELEKYNRLGITTARQCFANAADYARKAINEGFTPLSKSQWYDTSTGFNTPNNSWLWCITWNGDNGLIKDSNYDWMSWVSFQSPEASYGVCTPAYSGGRMIDADLWTKIADGDWRKLTWIDPDDAGSQQAYDEKYSSLTSLNYTNWSLVAGYVGFKFRPNGGSTSVANVGKAVSVPLMRVEEMYLIEAEALARSEGAGAGTSALESFMKTYRMDSGSTYTCASSQLEDVIDEILTQKRIELWGEGQTMWDYRRMRKEIRRGYPGSNHPSDMMYNSYPGLVAPWLIMYIPDSVHELNPNVQLNPDASKSLSLWTGQ